MKSFIRYILNILSLGLITICLGSCLNDFTKPHNLNNDLVTVSKKLYSPNNSNVVLYYQYNVGARGTRSYKSILKSENYKGNLMKYNLPPELIVKGWRHNDTLEVIYDWHEPIRIGSLNTDLDLSRDTLTRNGVTILVVLRKNNPRDFE